MKKVWFMMLWAVTGMCAAHFFTLHDSGIQVMAEEAAEQELLSAAADFASDILAGDYDRLKTEYTYSEAMQAAADSGQLEQAFKPYVEQSGLLMEQKEAFVSGSQGEYTNVDVPCAFMVQSWNLTVSFGADGEIAGAHVSQYQEGLPAAPEGVTETELVLEIEGGRQLPGTLTMPAGEDAHAAVVFVHGSGASDRNETIGSIAPFQDLAWGLAEQGIASYRYDKVTYVYGEEIAEDEDFTVYDETVNDAVAAIELMRQQPGISAVYVAGHSQGGMMMGAIAQSGAPDGCILLAAPAGSFDETLERQILYLESLEEDITPEEQQVYDYYKEEIEKMRNLDDLEEGDTVLGQSPAYIQSLLDYDALAEAKGISQPVLALQGEEDYQVTMEDFALWQEQFQDEANWSFRSFPGLTHLFTEGTYEEGPDAYNGEKHIPDEVIEVISEFVLQESR